MVCRLVFSLLIDGLLSIRLVIHLRNSSNIEFVLLSKTPRARSKFRRWEKRKALSNVFSLMEKKEKPREGAKPNEDDVDVHGSRFILAHSWHHSLNE